MSTLIKIICYKSKTLANGEHPLMLYVSKDGKRKQQSLGISMNPKYWDFKKNQPKLSCPNKDYINKIIADKISELQETVLQLKADKRSFTSTALIDQTKEKYQEKSIEEFFQTFIQQLEKENKVGNCHFYRRTYNSLKTFNNGNLDIPFSTRDTNRLSRYEKWLRSKQNKETSISIVFRTFRSLYNKAIDQHCARKTSFAGVHNLLH